jgi:hypothetical protein
MSSAFGNDSLSALTGGKAQVVTPTRQPLRLLPRSGGPAPAAKAHAPAGRGQGQLRLSSGTQACVIKALSLKEALLVVRRGDVLPQVLESAVLDLEQGESAEVARLEWLFACYRGVRAQARQRLAATDLPLCRSGCRENGLPVAPDRPRHGAESTLCRVRELLLWERACRDGIDAERPRRLHRSKPAGHVHQAGSLVNRPQMFADLFDVGFGRGNLGGAGRFQQAAHFLVQVPGQAQ